jgi:hypothetical protein
MYQVTKVCRMKESARFDSSLCHQEAKTRNTKTVITPLIIGGISPNLFVGSSNKAHDISYHFWIFLILLSYRGR